LNQLYRFVREMNINKTKTVDIVFYNQIEAVLDDLIKVVSTELTASEIILLYALTEDGESYCSKQHVEEAVFLDIMSDTFDTILGYSHLFPIEEGYTSVSTLRDDIRLFSTWVINTLCEGDYGNLTKENFKNLRSVYASSKKISA